MYPVGHLVGTLGPTGWSVRIGHELRTFASEADFTIWGLAHGDETRVGVRPWSLADLLDSAAALDDPAGLGGSADRRAQRVERLLSGGTLVAATPGTLEATEFARSHRLRPLMHGLYRATTPPDTYGVGITFHSQPSAYLSEDLYVIWRLAPHTTSLLDLAERLSRQAIESGIDEAAATVDVVLKDILGMLHVILAQHAGYLDRAAA